MLSVGGKVTSSGGCLSAKSPEQPFSLCRSKKRSFNDSVVPSGQLASGFQESGHESALPSWGLIGAPAFAGAPVVSGGSEFGAKSGLSITSTIRVHRFSSHGA